MTRIHSILTMLFAFSTSLAAQTPLFDMSPAVRPGGRVFTYLVAAPGASWTSWIDLDGRETRLGPLRFYLGFTPALTLLEGGVMGAPGIHSSSIPVPSSTLFDRAVIYGQALVLAPGSTTLALSNGESTCFTTAGAAIVHDFLDAQAAGFTGSYDASVKNRLQGAAVSTRLHVSIDPAAMPVAQPFRDAMTPFGARQQIVFRPLDLGASGAPERLVAIRWKPIGGQPRMDRFARFQIDAGHSHILPDYTIDPISLLPIHPNSGLNRAFALNYKPNDPAGTVTLASGAYTIDPANLRPDGYLDFPIVQPFPYNGNDSLLLDFKVFPDLGASGSNGQSVNLMVATLPRPYARVSLRGSSPGQLVDPSTATVAREGDNALPDYQFEFARVQSTALSRFIPGITANLDYQTPIVAASIPPGTSIAIEYRGSSDLVGTTTTPWSTDINIADGSPFIQYRVTFAADHLSGAVPSIDTLVIPMG